MIKSLASLRFVFALFVFLHHIDILEDAIGHAFFYTLSGFILSYVYYDRFLEKKINRLRFLKLRFSRLYPLYMLTLLIAIPISVIKYDQYILKWIGQFLSTVFMVQSFIPNNHFYFSFNGLAWSISNLFFFYIMFPYLVYWFDRIRNSKLVLLFIAAMIGLFLLMQVVPEKRLHFVFYINPFFRILDFAMGILLFKLIRNWSMGRYNKRYVLWELLAIGVLVLFYTQADYFPKVIRYSIYYWIPMFFFIGVFALQKGYLSKGLSNKVFLFLGELSFGFYLYHQLVIRYAEYWNEKYHVFSVQWHLDVICFIVILCICYVSYHFFEMPAKNRLRKFLGV